MRLEQPRGLGVFEDLAGPGAASRGGSAAFEEALRTAGGGGFSGKFQVLANEPDTQGTGAPGGGWQGSGRSDPPGGRGDG